MNLSDFDFHLPDDLIALRPAKPRPSSRLLVDTGRHLHDAQFSDLTQWLRAGDRLVINNTLVIPARLQGQRRRFSGQGETYSNVEVTLLSAGTDGNWMCFLKPAKRVAVGETIVFGAGLEATLLAKSDDGMQLHFNQSGAELDSTLDQIGRMPLPPYIASKRKADAQDNVDYQTVFAKKRGAVAAPTASLHFDKALMATLKNIGVSFSEVTLHVGAGTFLPVKVDVIDDHKMHSEWGNVSAKAAQEIAETRKNGGRVIAVGTTALRLIETAAQDSGTISAWTGDTDIFIKPGFEFKVTDGLITNFHLPKSTLLMLVAALIGLDRLHEIYAHATAQKYRFFSYGDGSLLFPDKTKP